MANPVSTETLPAAGRIALVCVALAVGPVTMAQVLPATWPQQYTVKLERKAGLLTLSTPYYSVEHDTRRGGAISRIRLVHGREANLLVAPMETRLHSQSGSVFSDLYDRAPRVDHTEVGLTEIVAVESEFKDDRGLAAKGLKLKNRYEYHWGYIKIRKEFVMAGDPVQVGELCALSAVLSSNLTAFGYREGTTEQEGAPAFSFGSCRWGKLGVGEGETRRVHTVYLPRYLLLADPGVEGLEWFSGSDLYQWDLQLAGKRGKGRFVLESSREPAGLAVSISPFVGQEGVWLTNSTCFDFYVGIPILEGRAQRPWLHTSFNRNRGEWVSPDTVRGWAESGIQTVHCHNDGDYYDDGFFWRDGSYPPYPDMYRYDKVIRDCHDVGIRVATYFSNKELHPSTREYRERGLEWGRKNLQGSLQHNFFRGTNEFGVQMCLRSGWLDFLKFSIDRVLRNHALDGVYYDWNVALLCCNRLHGDKGDPGSSAHWDIDELLQLMEWTRRRVGPGGLVILHNTTTPMFATENLANHIVANEWGYGKWAGNGPELTDLPLEWSLVGARPRGVISYGQLDDKSPKRLHRVFALEALVSGVTPWPASPETFQIFPVLKPIGRLDEFRFAGWRNRAVTLEGARCASAVYSRPGEAFLLLANLNENADEIRCTLSPENLPHPISRPKEAKVLGQPESSVDIESLLKGGAGVRVPGDSALLVRVR